MRKLASILLIIFSFHFSSYGNQDKNSNFYKTEIEKLNKKNEQLEYKIRNLESKNADLESKIQYQDSQINNQTGMLDTAFDGVSAEISAASNYIGIFSVIIALISVGIGWYVTKIEKSIKSMNKDSETLTEKNIAIKQSVEALSSKITKDSRGLYNIIRNEESNHILERLISVPEDINNLFFTITSRDLEKEHFPILKEAYSQVRDNAKYKDDYLSIFFQHFAGLSIIDEDIKSEFIENLSHSFGHSFKNDVVKSSKDFFTAIFENDITNYKDEINNYVTELCNSPFKDSDEVYFAINNIANTRDLKFNLFRILESKDEVNHFRRKFGNLILEHNYEDYTENEQLLVNEINDLNS